MSPTKRGSGVKQAVLSAGPIDILVANAGTATAPFAKTTPTSSALFDLNVMGVVQPVQPCSTT